MHFQHHTDYGQVGNTCKNIIPLLRTSETEITHGISFLMITHKLTLG